MLRSHTSTWYLLNRPRMSSSIDKFDPSLLVDSIIEPDTYEADFIEHLPEESYSAFVMYLELLRRLKRRNAADQKWKVKRRLKRTEAKFKDARYLHGVLLQEDLYGYIPFGINPMVEKP
jgi:hypothetical protein